MLGESEVLLVLVVIVSMKNRISSFFVFCFLIDEAFMGLPSSLVVQWLRLHLPMQEYGYDTYSGS